VSTGAAQSIPAQPDRASVFISYAREDKDVVLRLAEALRLNGLAVCGDWQLVRGENYQQQLDDLFLESDTALFIISPDSLRSVPCRAELDRAVEQNKRILPVVSRDPDVQDRDLPAALALPQWTFLRDGDDFVSGVQGLVDAVNTDFDLMPEHRRLLQAAENWQRHNRSAGYLLRKDGLKSAEAWLVKTSGRPEKLPKPTPLQLAYIHTSQQSRTRGSRITSAVVGAIAIAMSALAVIAYFQRNEARAQKGEALREKAIAERQTVEAKRQKTEAERQATIANAGRLATAGLLYKDSQLDLAALLSVEAWRTADAYEPRNALFSVLQVNPSLRTYLRQSASVENVVFSPDGKLLASASDEGPIRVWDVAGRRLSGRQLPGQAEPFRALAVTPNGTLLAGAVAGNSGAIRLWDMATRRSLGEPLRSDRAVYGLAFSPDGQLLAAGDSDKAVRLWNVRTRQPEGEPLRGHTETVCCVVFSPDGRTLASSGRDSTIILWDIASRRRPANPLKTADWVSSIAWSPDGKVIVAGLLNGEISVWDAVKQQPLATPTKVHAYSVNSVTFSPDGQMMASGSSDATIRLWDTGNWTPLGEALKGPKGAVTSVAFRPDGNLLASSGVDGVVRFWDMSNAQPFQGEMNPRTLLDYTHEKKQYLDRDDFAFSPDGKLLASANDDGALQFFDVATQQPLGPPMKRNTARVRHVAFNPSGTLLASADNDRAIRLWDVARRQPVGAALRGHTGDVYSVAFSPDGKLLASAATDRTVRVWSVSDQTALGEPLKGHTSYVAMVTFSPDGSLLASASWDQTIRLWNVASRQPVGASLKGHDGYVDSVAFSPDGKLLVSSSREGMVGLWDVTSKQLLTSFRLEKLMSPTGAAFSPDGNLLAATSGKTLQMWDVAGRQTVGGPIQGHGSPFGQVVFSPDGKLLATGGSDNHLRFWDVSADSWAARLCRLANRNLSWAEWEQNIGRDVPYHRTCPDLPAGEGVAAPPAAGR